MSTKTRGLDEFGNEEEIPEDVESNTRKMFEHNPPLDHDEIAELVGFWGKSDIKGGGDLLLLALDWLRMNKDGDYKRVYKMDSHVFSHARIVFEDIFGYDAMGEE